MRTHSNPIMSHGTCPILDCEFDAPVETVSNQRLIDWHDVALYGDVLCFEDEEDMED